MTVWLTFCFNCENNRAVTQTASIWKNEERKKEMVGLSKINVYERLFEVDYHVL